VTPAAGDDPVSVLRSVLTHEVRLGHTDRASIGGIEQFWRQWLPRVEARLAGRAGQLARATAAISGYASASQNARAEAIRIALAALGEADSSAANRSPSTPDVASGASVASSTRLADDKSALSSPRPAAKPIASAPKPDPTSTRAPATSLPAARPQAASRRSGATRASPSSSVAAAGQPSTPTVRPAGRLEQPITSLRGVGATQSQRLRKLGLSTVRDLLHHFPTRYIDYADVKRIAELEDLGEGKYQTVVGRVVEARVEKTRSRGRPGGQWMFSDVPAPRSTPTLLRIVVRLQDETGAVEAVWLRPQDYLSREFTPGRLVAVSGVCRRRWSGYDLEFSNPDFEFVSGDEAIHTGRLVPVYAKSEGIGDRWLRRVMKLCLDEYAAQIAEFLPPRLLREANLLPLPAAMTEIHFPDSEATLAAARRRLAFDELLLLQLSVLQRRIEFRRGVAGPTIASAGRSVAALMASLPYQLTGAQQRSLDEILTDLASPVPMRRLLQGDVGSGKTVVAALAAVAAIASGYQVAVMAPTEILAEQHYRTLSSLFGLAQDFRPDGQPVSVALLTGGLRRSDRESIRKRLAEGEIDLLVGTHALIQQDVEFANLGLVVVDEQHRFGVLQRDALRQKGTNPHLLVMTATPIPRSLALTVFGDLDLSVIDELPPGRQAIRTRTFAPEERDALYASVREEIRQGHQAYVICPLVEESDRSEAKAATAEYDRLRKTVFADLRVGLLHGRMKGEDKDAVMRSFQRGDLDVLVSTAVVEVGIDVPNATVIVVEGAERFGLSQLHQFRGRVGRGSAPSYCALLSDSSSADTLERLAIVANTPDGFALAEHDLRLRGPGEFLGTRQSGLPDLKMASVTDLPLVSEARRHALALLEDDPDLAAPEHRALAERVEQFWKGGQVN